MLLNTSRQARFRSKIGVNRRGITVRIVDTLLLWVDRHNGRRALLEMDEHRLKDIGISRADAEHEARKPFWLA